MWKWISPKEVRCNGMLPRCLPGTQVKGPDSSERGDVAKVSVYSSSETEKCLIPTRLQILIEKTNILLFSP